MIADVASSLPGTQVAISLDSASLTDSALNNICSREEVLAMKKVLGVALAALLLLGISVVAMAWGPGMGMGYGYGPGMMGYGPQGQGGGWGPGAMMGGRGGWGRGAGFGPGAGPCWQQGATGATATAIDDAKAKQIATEYVTKNLPGYTVEKFVKFERPRGTMYQVELKGPKDEVRYIHINPFGNVVPFGAGRSF
jgi:hypothetical protein